MPALTASICSTCSTVLDSARGHGRCAACLFAAAFEEEPAAFGGHELLGEIARGGMGVVYRARQREPEREVALKTLRGASLDSPEALARFRNEAAAMAGLAHPAILPVFTFGEEDGIPFFTMKLALGGTLGERLAGFAGKWKAIAELLASVADAVHHAHTRAVLHRDLKPGNILFDEDARPCVSDFGIAKLTDGEATLGTLTATVLGTPHYVAPEVAAGGGRAATTASDQWALGVILYELLAQRRPFAAESIPALLRAITDTDPAPLPGVPRDLATIAMKALAKEPARRYASASALAEDLRRWLAGQPIAARPVSALEKARLWMRRNPALTLTMAIALATAVAAAALLWRSNRDLRHALAHSLVEQAELARTQVHDGTRADCLRLLREAAALAPRPDPAQRAQWRTEALAALALPDIRITRRIPVFTEHNAGSEHFSADLSRYAAAQPGGFAVFDTASGKAVREFRPEAGPAVAEWRDFSAGAYRLSPDAGLVLAAFIYPDRKTSLTRLFDVRTGASIGELPGEGLSPSWPPWAASSREAAQQMDPKLPGHTFPVSAVAFAGDTTLSLANDERIIWQKPGTFRLTMTAQPRLLQLAADGTRIAFAPVKGTLAIADLIPPLGGRAWVGAGGHKMASCLGASADGRTLVLSTNKVLQLWDGPAGTLRESLPWPAGFESRWPWFEVEPRGTGVVVAPGPHPAVFNPLWHFPIGTDGRFAAPRRLEGTAPWDTIHGFTPGGADWIVSGKAAAAQTASAIDFALWPGGDPARSRTVLQNVTAAGMHICTPDARQGITAAQHSPDARVWDLTSGKLLRTLGYTVPVTCIVAPGQRTVAIISPEESSLWDTATWVKRAAWKTPPGGDGFTPGFSPDGKVLAQLDRNGQITLHFVGTGNPWLTLTLPAAFSARECVWLGPQRLVVMSRVGELYEWDLEKLGAAVVAEGLPW